MCWPLRRRTCCWTRLVCCRNGRSAWKTVLPQVQAGEWYFKELFVNGERRFRSRLPKKGFYNFADLPPIAFVSSAFEGQSEATLNDGQVENWRNLNDVEFVALHFWTDSHLPVKSVDKANNKVCFAKKSVFRLTQFHHPEPLAPYYIDNVFEALEEPGEWYLDRSLGTLYYLPKEGEAPENSRVIAPYLSRILLASGDPEGATPIRNIRFEGLKFRHGTWSLPAWAGSGFNQAADGVPGAVAFCRAEDCEIKDCAISQVRGFGVEISEGCKGIRVVGNIIADIGAGGVRVYHDTSETTIHNNEISDGGKVFHSAVGIWVGTSHVPLNKDNWLSLNTLKRNTDPNKKQEKLSQLLLCKQLNPQTHFLRTRQR